MFYKNERGSQSDIPWRREDALTDGSPRYMMDEEDTFARCGEPITLPSGSVSPCACMARYTETGECIDCTAKALWGEALANPQMPTTPQDAETLGLDYVFSPVPCREGPHLRTYRINGDGEACTTCRDALPPRQLAEDKGFATYVPKTKCKQCKTKSPRYTETGHCVKCEGVKGPVVISARQKARSAGQSKYMPETICLSCGTQSLRRVNDSSCDGCRAEEKAQKPVSPRKAAKLAGQSKYMPDTPCPHCHTRSLKRVHDGVCDGCREERKTKNIEPSSRAAAKKNGQANYMPLDVCLSCGTQSLRSVKDDTCEGCTKVINDARKSLSTGDQVNDATRAAMGTMPEGQVISIEVAQSCGFDAFRPTGGTWLHIKTLKALT